jgi:hypothetical protein
MKQGPENKLWKVFSEYIRMRDADDRGICHCATCGKPVFWKEADAGHFVTRNKKTVKFDERNVHAQCSRCNRFLGGEQYRMGLYIDNKYGKGTAHTLQTLGRFYGRIDAVWCDHYLKKYRKIVKEMKKHIPQEY